MIVKLLGLLRNFKKVALVVAVYYDFVFIVKLLLKAGAYPNLDMGNGFNLLMLAEQNGNTDMLKALLEGGSNPNCKNDEGNTALMFALHHNNAAAVEILLMGGANPDIFNKKEYNALMIAAEKGNVAMVKRLIMGGADPNVVDESEYNALMIAAYNGHVKVVELLIKKINPDIVSKQGYNALFFAIQEGHVEVVQALIKGGANLNFVYKDGETPLFFAAKWHINSLETDSNPSESGSDYFEIVKELIKNGADINQVVIDDDEPKTLFEIFPLYSRSYSETEYLIPIFLAATDGASTQVIVNLYENLYFSSALDYFDPQDVDPKLSLSILKEFKRFESEDVMNIQVYLSKAEKLNHVMAKKLEIITSTRAGDSTSIGKVIKFFKGFEIRTFENIFRIPEISRIIVSYLGWQKNWSPVEGLEEEILNKKIYSSNDDIINMLRRINIDLQIIADRSLDSFQEIFSFSNEVKQDIARELATVKKYRLSINPKFAELFYSDENNFSQFMMLELIAKRLSYEIKYFSEKYSIINFSAGEYVAAKFKIYESFEGGMLIEKQESIKDIADFSLYKVLTYLKTVDVSINIFQVIVEPSVENIKALVRDAAHLGIIYTETTGYLSLVNALDILIQVNNGQYKQAVMQTGATAIHLLLPFMLGTALESVYISSLTVYTGYKIVNKLYNLYLNHGTAEAILKSNLAYASLESKLGLEDQAKDRVINAMKIYIEEADLDNNLDSSILEIFDEYKVLGKLCELTTEKYDFCISQTSSEVSN